jgi:hypothetical protein
MLNTAEPSPITIDRPEQFGASTAQRVLYFPVEFRPRLLFAMHRLRILGVQFLLYPFIELYVDVEHFSLLIS